MLLRALRDFNLGKLTADDTSIFMGLLNDLFPKTVELVPRAVDREFEAKARAAHPLRSLSSIRSNPGQTGNVNLLSQMHQVFTVRRSSPEDSGGRPCIPEKTFLWESYSYVVLFVSRITKTVDAVYFQCVQGG